MSTQWKQTMPDDVAAFVDTERGTSSRSECVVWMLRELQRLRQRDIDLIGTLAAQALPQKQPPPADDKLDW